MIGAARRERMVPTAPPGVRHRTVLAGSVVPVPRLVTVLPVAAMVLCAAACRDVVRPAADVPSTTLGQAEADGAAAPAPAPPAPEALPDAILPDLTRVEPALRERIMARQAGLVAAEAAPGGDAAARAQAFAEVGKVLLAAEYYDAAEVYFRHAQAQAPADRRWPYYLGHVHRLRQDPTAALTSLEAARRLDGDDVPTLLWLGQLYAQTGRAAEGTPLLERALRLQPSSASARAALGRAALDARRYADAVQQFEAALASEPSALALHYPLASAYRGLGEARRADAHLRLFKDVGVSMPDPLMDDVGRLLRTSLDYTVRGTRALDARRWPDAVGLFTQGLALSPGDPVLHQNLGTALYLSGDTEQAVAHFQEAVRILPGYPKAHFTLGVIFDAAGHDAEAVDHLTRAVTGDPGMADARLALADALRRVGQFEAALAHYDKLLRDDPGASRARFGQAMAFVRAGRFADARGALERGASDYPDQPGFTHALARVLAAAPDGAVRDGRRALGLAEALRARFRSPALTETVAMALAETGQFGKAVTMQRAAIAETRAARQVAGPQLDENLARYARAVPCRVPWRDDDPVHQPRAAGEAAR